jgi:hypothetical protein
MSTLYVDNLQPNLGSGVHIPNHVVQTVYNYGTGGDVTTTSTTAVSTGLSVTITPKYANSILKVSLMGGRNYNNSSGVQMDIYLYRDGVNNPAHTRWTSVYNNSATSIHYGAWSCVEFVSANSTTATTFEVYFKTSSGTSYFNQTGGTTDIQPVLYVEEIAQ